MKEYLEILRDIETIEKKIEDRSVTEEDEKTLDELIARKKEFEDKQAELKKKVEEARKVNIDLGGNPKAELDERIAKMNMRDKLSFVIGKQARNKAFSEAEKRALGTALTTTATTFVEATESVDGINNAGVMISTSLLLDLLREEGKLSPILRDINFLSVAGLVEFPYRETRDKAKTKAEGVDGKQNQMKWNKLQLSKGYLQTVIAVTDEVQALTDFDFGAYLVNQILIDLNDDWASELIYGTGSDDRIKGLTVGATAAVAGGYTVGSEVDAIVKGIKNCKGKYRRGAKIYAAQDVYDTVLFAIDDNGNFKYPVLNNTTGIASVGPLRIEVDENLNDGDFIIGNVNQFFKANLLLPLRIETERHARKAITEYIASVYCASAPFSGAFIHGSKKS